nr:lytic transglycosylase domain-containing protein [Acinetobacter sp. CFCC 10889]
MGSRWTDFSATWGNGVNKSVASIKTAGQSIANTTAEGNQSLLDLYLPKDKESKPPPPIKPPPNTFNSNKGIGTGTKDDDKKASDKAKSDAEKKQDILTVNDRVKANAVKYNFAGLESNYGLPNGLLSAINMQESRGNGNAIGPMTKYGTAKGGFQFLDGTAKRFGITNPFDTKQAAEGASKYLRFLLDKYGDINKAISAYHAGEGNVDRGTNIGPVNRQYVKNVKGYMAGVNGVESGTESSDYDKALQEQIQIADKAEKERLELKYKYASEQEKVEQDLAKAIQRINDSTASTDDKTAYRIKAEQEAQAQIVEIKLKALDQEQMIDEREIQFKLDTAQRIFEIEKANIQAAFDAGRISNVEKLKLEKRLEDQMYQIKREGLSKRLDLEVAKANLTGKDDGLISANNAIVDLDHQKAVSDTQKPQLLSEAEMADFEKKFGGLTSRMSSLWDQGIQAMMNGTLTWKNALNAIYSELAAEFIQQMITAPMKKYVASMAPRLAAKLGLIKAETAIEVAGQTAQTAAVVTGETTKTAATSTGVFARLGLKLMEVLKSIMMSAWEAMAAAWAAMSAIPIIGPALGVAAGIAAFAGVSAIVGKVASARGGYDIPAGVNPMTQLHEEEMVLPKQHANTIRALGKSVMSDGSMPATQASGVGGGDINNFNFQSWDSKDLRRFMKKHGRELAGGLKGYGRNFGK